MRFEGGGAAESPPPELRIDPLSGLHVLIAHSRASRPGAWLAPGEGADEEQPDSASDPFAEGNERLTPPEIDADRVDGSSPNQPGWHVRVVPNKFPALSPPIAGAGASPVDEFGGRGEVDLFVSRPAFGAHEVIVNSPRPVTSLADLSRAELARALTVWRRRMRAGRTLGYPHLIVNEGRAAGASLPHTHAQLYVLPFVPAQVARERERFTAYFERTQGRNLLADLVQQEVRNGERVVAVDDECVAFCPFAARAPFHIVIAPRCARPRFEDEDGAFAANLLAEVLARLRSACGHKPPLNLFVRTAPDDATAFCWRIELLPRLAQPAGLELGAGVHCCPLAPEQAARLLR